MAGGLITDYLSQGLAADRPATPSAATGTLSFYFASDTEVLSYYDWNDAAWQTIVTGTGGLLAANNLSDLTDDAAARSNLGLGTLATQSGTFSGTSSGTNTGDQTITLTGDVTGSGTGSFATTLANTAVVAGSYTNANITVDAKGRVTAAASGTASGGTTVANGLVTGGVVVWDSAYTFRVSAATYYIGGTLYSAAEQTVTLTTADATLDRIDVLYLDTTGTLGKITGTAASQPSEPDYDPTTQLKLTFVLVAAASSTPAGVSNENVYLENTEWTTSTSGSGFNANSSTNPYAGTKDIEGTAVANGAYVQLQRGSSSALDAFATLGLFIRSKATWANGRILRLQFFLNGVAKGSAVTLASGYWGFDSSITASYQFIGIPVAQFVLPAGTLVNQLRITDVGGSIGFYLDNIILQARSTSLSPQNSGITQNDADARYAQRANNLSDLTSASTARTNLGLGTAATQATGTSGATVPLLNGANTHSALATFSAGIDLTPAATPSTTAAGYLGAPQVVLSGTTTTVMSDAGKHFYHTSGSAHTVTIDSNANVAYPIGTILTFINESGGGVVTIAITSDTLRWGSSTGSRSLAANGTATAIKVASTVWRLTGDGIT